MAWMCLLHGFIQFGSIFMEPMKNKKMKKIN